MKTKLAGLLAVILITTTQCIAQQQYTVEAQNNDISNNLDLKAVATAFGESKNLEEFERKLNDYDSGISNLDLNKDGQVDYLRVIEKNEKNVHVVLIQSVLDKDVYQDVASIVVDRDRDSENTTVQVIGDPYLYGPNYIIEPAYAYTPSIFSLFWGANYYSWHSPYYWGYYPNYYHHRNPFELNVYLSNVYGHVNHNHRYYYSNSIRNQYAAGMHSSISRNDYANIHPEHTFARRNENIRNKRDFEFNRNGVRNGGSRPAYQQNRIENTPAVRNYDNSNNVRNNQSNGWNNQRNPANNNVGRDNSYQNRNQNTAATPTYTPAPTRNSDGNNYNNRGNQNNSINRNNNARPNVQVTQPARTEQRTTTSSPAPAQRETRSNSSKTEERR